jgi:hypothetical protein
MPGSPDTLILGVMSSAGNHVCRRPLVARVPVSRERRPFFRCALFDAFRAPGGTSGTPSAGYTLQAVIVRPVSPAQFAVRFGLEPVDVEWLMGAYRRGMSDDKLRSEIEVLGCSASEAQRVVELIARETAALVG